MTGSQPSPLELRYRNGSGRDFDGPYSPVIDLMLRHRTTRNFQPDSLPPNILEILLGAGQSASTASGWQTWSVISIVDPQHKAEVATLCGEQDFIRQAPLFLLFCSDLNRPSAISKQEMKPGKGLEHMDMFVISVIDAAMAAQNVALAAESLGYGMCYVGAARNNAAELSKLLRLPPRVIGLFGLAIGKPNQSVPTSIKPRLNQREVLHSEYWEDDRSDEHLRAYDVTLGRFYEDQGKLNRQPWTKHTAEKLASGQLDGRERYAQVLQQYDFRLK